jgi:periplasmic nitrate reductase NapD
MAAQLHIASIVVHCVPPRIAALTQSLLALPGAVVHAVTPEGRVVLTLEADSGEAITSSVAGVQQLQGVLSAALVYQCADDLAAMNQEMPEC